MGFSGSRARAFARTVVVWAWSLAWACGDPVLAQDRDRLEIRNFDDLSQIQLNGAAATLSRQDGVLHLTNDYWQASSAFHREPISLAGDASFSTYFRFRIANARGLGDGADGIVFVVQTDAADVGGEGGSIGFGGISPSLGVEFDTFPNGGDPDGNHVGIDVDGSTVSLATASLARPLDDGGVWHAWIDYDGAADLLEVRAGAGPERPAEPILSRAIDLAPKFGNAAVFVGFTSGTGAGAGDHDVLDWRFFGFYAPDGADAALWPWVLLSLLGAAAGGAAVRRRRRRKAPDAPPGLRIEVLFPGLPKSVSVAGFALSADTATDADGRPVADFVIRVFERRDAQEVPVPDGTEVALEVRSAHGDAADAPVSRADIEIALEARGQRTLARTLGGKIFGRLRCGPSELFGRELAAAPSARYRLGPDGLEPFEAASFVLSARVEAAVGSETLEIAPGEPHTIELVGTPEAVGVPASALRAPGDVAPIPGEALIAIEGMRFVVATPIGQQLRIQHAPRMIRFGGWMKAPPFAPGSERGRVQAASLVSDVTGEEAIPVVTAMVGLVAKVTDRAGNPVPLPLHASSDPGRPVLRFVRWKSSGSQAMPYVMSSDAPGKPGDPKEARWAAGYVPPFPDNVFSVFLAPCYAVDGGAETDLAISIGARTWTFRVSVAPTTTSGKLKHWFVSGEIPSKEYFAGEIALALVPFLGDGRDLVIYGIKLVNGEELSGVDHAVAVLSLAGLILDIVPVAIHVNAAAASAKAAVKLLRKIPEEPAQALAKAISDHLGESAADIYKLAKGDELADSKEFAKYKDAIAELGALGDAIKQAKTLQQAQRLLTALGLVVTAVGLAPLLQILGNRTVEEVLDLLEGLLHMDESEAS